MVKPNHFPLVSCFEGKELNLKTVYFEVISKMEILEKLTKIRIDSGPTDQDASFFCDLSSPCGSPRSASKQCIDFPAFSGLFL
jgi:hypothetical protein